MLHYQGMNTSGAVVHTIRVGVACLLPLVLSSVAVSADALREEAVAYRNKGYELQRQGSDQDAYSWYQKAIALDPSYPTPHNDLGVILEQQGRLEEAQRAYQRALAINPNYLEAHANLAMLFERVGDRDKAIYHWLKRYQLGSPGDPWTTRAEERLVALDVLKGEVGAGGRRFAHRHLIEDALRLNDQTIEEFLAISEQHGDWP